MRTPQIRTGTQQGFTLVEIIMVIVILGVVGGMVAVFMRGPIDAYFASARRAGLTDVADTTVRRMARDIRKALPNSIRTPSTQCVEFIQTKTGGRYRESGTGALSFSNPPPPPKPDLVFNELGANDSRTTDQRIVDGDILVIYNLGISGADAYAKENTAVITGVANGGGPETQITVTVDNANNNFPLASGSNRFHVVPADEQVVSFVCDTSSGVQRLYRTTASFANAGATSCTTSGALASGSTRSVLSSRVSSCNFDYSGSDLQRNALVRMMLQLTDSGETISLQHEVHVNNTP